MKKADLIVIAVVLAVVGVLVFFLYFVNGDAGKYVQIEADGKVVETFALNEDREYEYNHDGDTNTVSIKDGKVTVIEANCPDRICANHMPIKRSGESIICLPHKLVVTVLDKVDDENEIDAVA
ncbi:MAG: NusG domain II-containing protein [Eubacterium sp.]